MSYKPDMSELEQRARRASDDIQFIQSFLGENKCEEAKIEFPKGVIRYASGYQCQVSFLENKVLIKNISYSLIMMDVLRWLVIRTTIGLVAKEMIIKSAIIVLVSVVEAITKGVSELIKGKIVGGYENRLNLLVEENIISVEIRSKLMDAWRKRGKVHIPIKGEVEISCYDEKNINEIIEVYHEFIGMLEKYFSRIPERS